MGLLDPEIKPTKRQNGLLGLLADAISAADSFARKPFGFDNPPAQMISGLLGVPSIAKTLDDMSYGAPLTTGSGWATQMKPHVADTALAVMPNPRLAAGLLSHGMGGGAVDKAATVWHGSPHKFDRFDSSKIGTGEGAQAYGHGLYLAESPDVAQSYQALGHMQGNVGKVGGTSLNDLYNQVQNKANRLPPKQAQSYYDRAAMLEDLMSNTYPTDVLKNARANGYANDAVSWLETQVLPKYEPAGSLYKVDLPDPVIARMLNWDAPLSQQAPGVLEVLQAADRRAKDSLYQNGGEYYRALMSRHAQNAPLHMSLDAAETAAQAPASQQLRQIGIPGIRYLDGGSRGAGAGTSNFVVFPGEENILTILERNGIPLR